VGSHATLLLPLSHIIGVLSDDHKGSYLPVKIFGQTDYSISFMLYSPDILLVPDLMFSGKTLNLSTNIEFRS